MGFGFDLEVGWLLQQLELARGFRPGRRRPKKDRLYLGFGDGALALLAPFFEVAVPTEGEGEGWLSVLEASFAALIGTFDGTIRLHADRSSLRVERTVMPLAAVGGALGLGAGSAEAEEELEERAAAARVRALGREEERRSALAAALTWHRAATTINTSPLAEHAREGSIVVYRHPDAEAGAPSRTAVVDRKVVIGDRLSLLCHDLRGREITLDARWLTHVGC